MLGSLATVLVVQPRLQVRHCRVACRGEMETEPSYRREAGQKASSYAFDAVLPIILTAALQDFEINDRCATRLPAREPR